MMSGNRSPRCGFRRLLDSEGDDLLTGVANLFDIAMVFVVALLIALFASAATEKLPRSSAVSSAPPSVSSPDESVVPRDGEQLDRYRIGDRQIGGEGQRLGIAYQLQSGEVIYIPDQRRTAQ